MGISQGAVRRFELDKDGAHVVLYYDKERNLVGIKPTQDGDEEGAVKVNIRKYGENLSNTTAFFSAKSFLEYYSIPYKKSSSYTVKWDDEQNMIIVNLTESEQAEDQT